LHNPSEATTLLVPSLFSCAVEAVQSKNKIVNATNGGSNFLLNSNVVAGQSKNKMHTMQQLVVPLKMCLSGADTLH
jgi:hypothetical protein